MDQRSGDESFKANDDSASSWHQFALRLPLLKQSLSKNSCKNYTFPSPHFLCFQVFDGAPLLSRH